MTDEILGFRFRAYPSAEQESQLVAIECGLRRCWNWLCARSNDTRRGNEAWAERQPGVGKRPVPIDYNGMSADEARQAKLGLAEEWESWRKRASVAIKARPGGAGYRSLLDWQKHFYAPECGDKPTAGKVKEQLHDYQIFARALDWDEFNIPAAYLQSMCKSYQAALSATKRGQRPPVRRKDGDPMSLRSMTGKPLRIEPSGPRPSCPNGRADWCDASIKMPGVQGRIACRIGPESMERLGPPETWVCGVSLVREPDGWYAAIRQRYGTPSKIPDPDPGTVCGIDVGLRDLVALVGSDGETLRVANPRSSRWMADHISARQAADKPVGKALCRAARNVRQIVREQVYPITDRYEVICIEKLERNIGQRGRPHVSFMRGVAAALRARYGDMVREVNPCLTSQECSQCGHHSEKAWKDSKTHNGTCPACGYTCNRDLNAARNVMWRGAESLRPW